MEDKSSYSDERSTNDKRSLLSQLQNDLADQMLPVQPILPESEKKKNRIHLHLSHLLHMIKEAAEINLDPDVSCDLPVLLNEMRKIIDSVESQWEDYVGMERALFKMEVKERD